LLGELQKTSKDKVNVCVESIGDDLEEEKVKIEKEGMN
jgi:hypothetical protein